MSIGEVTRLRVDRAAGGGLDMTFDAIADASGYAVYFGRLSTLRNSGTYDHGPDARSGPLCDVATEPAGPNRLKTTVRPEDVPAVDAYVLATGRIGSVEGPSGCDVNGLERDRAQSTCP